MLFTFENGAYLPDGDVPLAHELSEPHLQHHERCRPAHQVDEVGHQERAAAVLVALQARRSGQKEREREKDSPAAAFNDVTRQSREK